MKNIIILLFLGAVGYFAWKHVFNPAPPPVQVFKQVMESWANGDMTSIRPMCANPMVENAFEFRTAESIVQPETFATIVEHTYEDVTVTEDDAANRFKVSARHSVFFNPPNVTAKAYASWVAVFDHWLELEQLGDEWQITDFRTSLVKKEINRFAGY